MKSIMSKIIIGIFAGACICIAANANQNINAADEVTLPVAAEPTEKSIITKEQSNVESVNLNSATAEQLMTLKGVGMQKAQAIIEYRKQHGVFKSMDELQNIKGFSPKVIAKLQANNPNKIVF